MANVKDKVFIALTIFEMRDMVQYYFVPPLWGVLKVRAVFPNPSVL